jgi:predicted nucleic acid-binding protein
MSAYADTSFLASLYVLDANSGVAAARMARAKLPVQITILGELELTNAISLRLFRGEITTSKAKAARSLLAKDLADGVFQLNPLPQGLFARAKQIARRQTPHLGTRTLDILHVASAQLLRADAIFTFDLGQERLAVAEGFKAGQALP